MFHQVLNVCQLLNLPGGLRWPHSYCSHTFTSLFPEYCFLSCWDNCGLYPLRLLLAKTTPLRFFSFCVSAEPTFRADLPSGISSAVTNISLKGMKRRTAEQLHRAPLWIQQSALNNGQ